MESDQADVVDNEVEEVAPGRQSEKVAGRKALFGTMAT